MSKRRLSVRVLHVTAKYAFTHPVLILQDANKEVIIEIEGPGDLVYLTEKLRELAEGYRSSVRFLDQAPKL